jgi:hypothetical protein
MQLLNGATGTLLSSAYRLARDVVHTFGEVKRVLRIHVVFIQRRERQDDGRLAVASNRALQDLRQLRLAVRHNYLAFRYIGSNGHSALRRELRDDFREDR